MTETVIKDSPSHIITDSKICNGSPIVSGTKTTVRSIVTYIMQGSSPEQLILKFPFLDLLDIYDALSFYLDNKELIDNEIKEDSNG